MHPVREEWPAVTTLEKSGSSRGLRGGSWNNNSNNLASSNRNNNTPTNENNNVGFRVARPPAFRQV